MEALPKPAHFGVGWALETDSLGGDDYFLGLATGWFPEQCAWADTEKAGLEAVESAYAASAEYDSDDVDISPVTAEIVVDSPAKAERRLSGRPFPVILNSATRSRSSQGRPWGECAGACQ